METWPRRTRHSLLGGSSWAFLLRSLTLLLHESAFGHGICLLGRFPGTPETCSGSSPSPEAWQPAHNPHQAQESSGRCRMLPASPAALALLAAWALQVFHPLPWAQPHAGACWGRRAHPAITATAPGPRWPSLATSSLPRRLAEGCHPQQSAAFVIFIVLLAALGTWWRSWCRHRGCSAPRGPSAVLWFLSLTIARRNTPNQGSF